jgi:hypothetical protein
MSGGSLDYFYSQLNDHVGDFKDKELDDLVSDLAQLFHDREWYLSGDTCEGSWNEARDNFKKKWFTEIGRQERLEKAFEETKMELLHSFGLDVKYCKDCRYWSAEEKSEKYGKCENHTGCLFHRCETCEKWEQK